jgi:hypothetical protein
MFASNFSTWILVALLTPFWWGMGLLVVPCSGTFRHGGTSEPHVLFNQLEGTHSEPAERAAALPSRHAGVRSPSMATPYSLRTRSGSRSSAGGSRKACCSWDRPGPGSS